MSGLSSGPRIVPLALQPAAARRRQDAEILRGQREAQIRGAIDTAVERQARAAETDANLLERPCIARVCQLATAARGEAAQSSAESVECHAEWSVRFEPPAPDVKAKIDAPGQVRSHLARVDAGRLAADLPALHGSPGHLAMHIGVSVEDIYLRATDLDAFVAQLTRDVGGSGGESGKERRYLRQTVGMKVIRPQTRKLEAALAASEWHAPSGERPAKVSPASP